MTAVTAHDTAPVEGGGRHLCDALAAIEYPAVYVGDTNAFLQEPLSCHNDQRGCEA